MTLMPERILARIAMRPRSDALYLIWFCWGLALLLYVAGSAYYKLPIVPLLLMVLLLMVEKTKMFGRKRNESEVVGAGSTTTVIAKGARFKGELQVEGNLEVHGQFVGTLQLNGGTVRIMEGGRIEGDVSAAHVIINGTLDGTCASSEVEILENGKMKGLFKGGSLSIRKGGQFVGQSQSQEEQKGESKGNVKQLQPEGKNKAVDAAEVVAKQA
ncbi:bactofilin family protein [Aeromonas hydrophila]|uniref:bactofilin family protein n=1 Tax=Aeromonas hydrophila TaxID=644 RepID=UPI001A20821A|nr:polymer-forming cytoskeletal protein [Aeromonas hydrophila]MCP3291322.1 polymer-forming cytoskeletal protein [Aeromonas hydrophila]HAU4891865.1 polymer-forming cytoskeletal protein [Aeromonas hydrophila]HAU4973208.1 polymer-forming cytoskeletal protein [Aeromonas hydrophila]HAU4982331.1 polymer-forming cytoskeletal protein [Aeromonas hydrophila]HDX8384294.1 polymer-forming cytoskeletal protein [Aeromonas hydrophila]